MSALSKRQQARNERTLQELIKAVPGNNVCADCQARNPGWASWSLGIFLCMRCAALHRKLGTHITKVKSLSMDSWSNDQVENMKRVGNTASNRIYNPGNERPPVPFDADEADSAMERFIRAKYQERATSAQARPQARQNTGSTNTSDDQPPPLPPKPGSRFGFRSASSIFPLSSKARREAAAAAARPDSQDSHERSPSPPRRNKPSRVFGTSVGPEGAGDLDSKLAKLRDMGFRDEKRNLTVLKGLAGNLERTIETLVRLEGGGNVKSGNNSGPSSRSRTPITPTAGITFDRTPAKSPATNSNNPFDMLDKPIPAPPQSSQSTGSLAHPQMLGNNPYQQATNTNSNPYGLQPSQSQYGLNQAFQNMSVSTSQPLFPHHTGGFPGPQQQQFHQLHQQSMTPPVPSMPQQHYPPVIYENPNQQPQQNYNPFMQQQQQQQVQQFRHAPPINTNFQSNPYTQQQPTPQATPVTTNFQSNPFGQQGQNYVQSPMEQQSAFYDNGNPQQQQQQQQQQLNPFLQNNQQQMPQQMSQQVQQQMPQQMAQQSYNYQAQSHAQGQQYQNQQSPQGQQQYQQFRGQTHPLLPQQTGRADKRSILDLYNYPQLAPTRLQPQQQPQDHDQNMPAPVLDTQQQQRSVSSPVSAPAAGNRNPFMISGGGGPQSAGGDSVGSMPLFSANQNGVRHVSQESMDVGGWQSGRHSPDAWGTISARSIR